MKSYIRDGVHRLSLAPIAQVAIVNYQALFDNAQMPPRRYSAQGRIDESFVQCPD
jgi:hypothetical protein